MPTKNPGCGDECDNGYRDFFVKNVERKTLRYERYICPFCDPTAPNDFRALPEEAVIGPREFFYLRDTCGWKVESLEVAVFFCTSYNHSREQRHSLH